MAPEQLASRGEAPVDENDHAPGSLHRTCPQGSVSAERMEGSAAGRGDVRVPCAKALPVRESHARARPAPVAEHPLGSRRVTPTLPRQPADCSLAFGTAPDLPTDD